MTKKKTAVSDSVKQESTKGVIQQRVVGLNTNAPRFRMKYMYKMPHPAPDPTSDLTQHHRCAVKALDYYNKKNGANYELVDIDASISNGFLLDAIRLHCNFKARPRVTLNGDGDSSFKLGSNTEPKSISNVDGDSNNKLFFAELIIDRLRWIVTSCCILKGKLGSCAICKGFLKHPTRGFRPMCVDHQTYALRPRAHC